MRVALLDRDYPSAFVTGVAEALAAAGHDVCVVTCGRGPARRTTQAGFSVARVRRLPEAPLRVRGFERPLTHLPFALVELMRGGFDVVHAFSPADAAIARAWRRARGGPIAFTCLVAPARENVSNRRLRLRLLEAALEESDPVLAADDEVRAAMWRWLAVDAEALAPADHVALYRRLLVRRTPEPRRDGPPRSRRL